MYEPAFRPEAQGTVVLTAGTASSQVQVQASYPTKTSRHVRIFNSGTAIAFIAFGNDDTVTADKTKDCPVGPGVSVVIAEPQPFAAACTGAGTSVVYFTPGEGR